MFDLRIIAFVKYSYDQNYVVLLQLYQLSVGNEVLILFVQLFVVILVILDKKIDGYEKKERNQLLNKTFFGTSM